MCYSFRNLFNVCYAMNEEEQENEENKVCLQCFHEMMDKWVLLFCFICSSGLGSRHHTLAYCLFLLNSL